MKPADRQPTVIGTLSGVWPFARPYLPRIAFSLALLVTASLIQLTLPLAIRQLLDYMTHPATNGRFNLLAAAMVGLFVTKSLINFVGQYNLQVTGDRITNELRVTLLDHYERLPLAYHYSHQTGDVMSRLYSSAPEVRNIVTNLTATGVVNLIQLIGAGVIMWRMDPALAMIVLLLCPATSIVARMFGPHFKRLSADIKDDLAKAMAFAQESLAGTHVVRIFAAKGSRADGFKTMMNRHFAKAAQGRRADAAYAAIIALLSVISTIVLFWYGGTRILAGAMMVGTLIAFFLYSQAVNQNIHALAQLYSSVNQSAGASEKILGILQESVEQQTDKGKKTFDTSLATIEFRNVGFRYYNSVPVLHDISFTARPGQTVAILGPSGIGKSSLLGLIPRFFHPCEGKILLNGSDLRDYSLVSLRQAIAVVSQDVFLFSTTVFDNIKFGRESASDDEVYAAAAHANADEFIVALKDGYLTHVGERGIQLSGGQRQRIAIARAFLKNAPILLLDEATSAVDSRTDERIHDALRKLTANRTTFVVAHRSVTITDADQVIDLSAARPSPLDKPMADNAIA
jgi:subfamily B ATP-binding cassette protein MsbA